MTRDMIKGAVACGHPATAEAAQEILQDGGNAFDAALAAMCAAAVAEPVLCSLGGGGFLLARPTDGETRVYDFFVQTPKRNRPLSEIDFRPAVADFGPDTQEFHIGLGSVATPGAVKGLCTVHRDLAALPLARIVEPAARLAREGVELRPVDAYLFEVVAPILTDRADCRASYLRPDGGLLTAGERFRPADMANVLEALAAEGEALFYRGDLARATLEACRAHGGLLSEEDLAGYSVEIRRPLVRAYHDATISMNPPPSTGGLLIAFALDLLSLLPSAEHAWDSPEALVRLARVMKATNRARIESSLGDAVGAEAVTKAAGNLLSRDLLESYARQVAGRPQATRGTTHVSVIDADGNLASLTLSNGEGCGYVLPGTGIMLNNMLGEEDLLPQGFGRWPGDTRLASMMTPTLATLADGSEIALGSGGSNRIRSAILQTLLHLIDRPCGLAEAIEAPRLHFERGLANLEGDLGTGAEQALGAVASEVKRWPLHNLFFGGVHAVVRNPVGEIGCAGDPRRGGAAVLA